MNTVYKLPPRCSYTLQSSRDNGECIIIRNKIGNTIINAREKTCAGADIKLDLNPLVGECRVTYEKIQRKTPKKHEIRQLKDRISMKANIEKSGQSPKNRKENLTK